VQGILDWLAGLPPVALYLTMAFAAGIENVFPPLPSDTVVAFGSFLAARGNGTIVGVFLARWVGNLAGATLMYGAGRKYGAERVERRLFGNRAKGEVAESKLKSMYKRYGMSALFLSRFIPGVRALVPPFAGALRLPLIRSIIVMGLASGIWYGLVSYLAFRVGSNWTGLQKAIGRYGRISAIVAVVVVAAAVAVWLMKRRTAHR
jgi:membrane protein DedA with SNARE-associated domain